LVVRSTVSGVLVMPRAQDSAGGYVKKGALLAHVLPAGETTVRTVLREDDVALLRAQGAEVAVRFADSVQQTWPARVAEQTPQASYELPSPALGDRGGGSIVTDPEDSDGIKSIEPFFVVDLKLPAQRAQHVGARAYARFALAPEPLAQRWLRAGRRVFLRHFASQVG
jgi:putative peptide zinc metalloprotease protein